MIINPKSITIFFEKSKILKIFEFFRIFGILTRKPDFRVCFVGGRTHFRPFFWNFLKFLKTLEYFSYLHQGHITLGWKVISGWKSLKMAKTPRNHSHWCTWPPWVKSLSLAKHQQKIAQNGLKNASKNFFSSILKNFIVKDQNLSKTNPRCCWKVRKARKSDFFQNRGGVKAPRQLL